MNYWPRWIRAIRGKTLTLSMAQMGAYDRLLDYYYEEERPLPTDLDECCRIAGAASKQDRADVQKVLAKFFVLGDAGYAQERADAELVIGLKKIATAQSNGKGGGRPLGSGKKPKENPAGLQEGTEQEPSGKAPHHHTSFPPEKKVGAKRAAAPECPSDVAEQVWSDWLLLRKGKRASVTQTVIDGARDEAAKAQMTLDAFLRVWCLRGSQGLEAAWIKPHEREQAMTFKERDAANAAARVAEMTGGLVSAKPVIPITRRNDVLQEVFDATPRLVG